MLEFLGIIFLIVALISVINYFRKEAQEKNLIASLLGNQASMLKVHTIIRNTEDEILAVRIISNQLEVPTHVAFIIYENAKTS
ncbi:hypothetical protein [Enterococcus sp. LJL90]